MKKHKLIAAQMLIPTVLFTLLGLWIDGSADAGVPLEPTPPIVPEKRIEKELATDAGSALQGNMLAETAPARTNQSFEASSVTDAEIIQGYPTAGCGNELTMRVGYDDYLDPDGQIVRGLVKFDLAGIPADATISSAQLQLYLVESWDYPGHSRTVTTYRIASPWAEDIVCWNNAPTLAEAYGSTPVTHGSWGWYSFDVTSLVRDWHNGTYANYGIALRGPEHSGSDSSWKAFATGETIYPPRLIINYTPLGGDFDLTVEPLSGLVSPRESISYTVSVSSTGGFTDGVSLAVGNLPDHTIHAWSANPITPTLGSLRVFSTLAVSTTASTPPGSYGLVITGTGGGISHTAHFILNVTVSDFGIMASPSGRVVTQGDVVTYTLSLTATELFSGTVALNMMSMPTGAVGVFTPNPVTPPTSVTLTVSTMEVMPDQYTLVITGTGGDITHTTSVTLTVQQRLSYIYLPVILRQYPLYSYAPVLHSIDNVNGEGEYTIDWEATDLAYSHTLQEYVNGDWQEPYETSTDTSFDISGKAEGTYRVLGMIDRDSTPSQEQSVTVSEINYNTVLLFIGVSDYLYMDPPLASVRAGSPGYDTCCSVYDTTDVADTFSNLGCCSVIAGQFLDPQIANDCGCPPANMLVLHDSEATKAAIQSAITNWLDVRETHDTTVVIFFSGHGAYGPDVAPVDETDGYDEYLAPHDLACDPCGPTPDTTIWDLETAIRDDELKDWLDELDSEQIILFVDSCFSGGMIEGTGEIARGISSANIEAVDVIQAGDGLLADLSGPGRVILTASTADQPSWEFGALKNGAFTYYLVEALQSLAADTNSNGQVSAEEAFAYLAGLVDSYVYGHTGSTPGGPYHQNPQLYDGVAGEVELIQPVAVTTCP